MLPDNINKSHIVEAIKQIKSEGIPSNRVSTKYDLFYEGRGYPPKYVLSLANKFANGEILSVSEFSGGEEANYFLINKGFNIIKKLSNEKYDSWTVYSELICSKKLDKSSIKYGGTGIPTEIRWFFEVEAFKLGEQREIVLMYQQQMYKAYIEMNQTGRTRLFWRGTQLNSLISMLFPEFANAAKKSDQRINNGPIMTFYKNKENYEVFFTETSQIASILQDIRSDEIENDALVKEGKAQFYYGKRYERKPINRKRAIEIHGCVCKVCGFDFERVYGDRGKDFIEVHHNKPLNESEGEEIEVNPETDLDPVCSNCHRMIHRRQEHILTVEELKQIINRNVVYK